MLSLNSKKCCTMVCRTSEWPFDNSGWTSRWWPKN